MSKWNPLDWLKSIRYRHWLIVAAIFLAYAIGKAYVLQTPSTHDDDIPDKIKDAVLILVHDADDPDMYDTDNT